MNWWDGSARICLPSVSSLSDTATDIYDKATDIYDTATGVYDTATDIYDTATGVYDTATDIDDTATDVYGAATEARVDLLVALLIREIFPCGTVYNLYCSWQILPL